MFKTAKKTRNKKEQNVTESSVISYYSKHPYTLQRALVDPPFPSFFFSFREVYDFSKYRDEAVKTFKEHRGELHPVTAMLVAKDLKIDG